MRRWQSQFQKWLWIFLLTAMVPGFARAGKISGYVYEQDGSTPIPNISVDIYTDRCHNGHLYGTQTGTNGYFEFTELSENQQFILRVDPDISGPYFISQWYDGLNDQEDCNQATFVSVGETVIFRLDPGAAVSGIVRDSGGNLITGVSELVCLISGDPCGSHQCYGRSWTELDDGAFTIVGIPAGTYFIRTCSAESDYALTWWNSSFGSENCAEAESFTVTVGQLASGFEFRLNPGGRITGRVTRESDNQPIANLWVMAHNYNTGSWGNGAHTNDQGYYEINGLPAGDYRVNVDTWGTDYVSEYYDDTRDWSAAGRVSVTAGQTTANIDMGAETGGTISGYVYQQDGFDADSQCQT